VAYSDRVWDKVRVDYEVHSMSFNKLSKKHGIAKSAILSRSNKQVWIKGKTDQLVSKKVTVKQELIELDKETGTLSALESREVDNAVLFSLEMIDIYQELEREIAKKTIKTAKAIEPKDPMAPVNCKNLAQALQALKNKGTPTTQVNIQDNRVIDKSDLETLTLEELMELRELV